MIITVEIINPGTLDLLRDLENMGLIHLQPFEGDHSQKTAEPTQETLPSYHRLRGIHKSIQGGSVEDFLMRSRADKEHELKIEKHREEERDRRAKLSS
jgi:hypothetical protein